MTCPRLKGTSGRESGGEFESYCLQILTETLLILLKFLAPLFKITHYCFDLARNCKPFQQLDLKNTILCTGSLPTIKCFFSLKHSSGL